MTRSPIYFVLAWWLTACGGATSATPGTGGTTAAASGGSSATGSSVTGGAATGSSMTGGAATGGAAATGSTGGAATGTTGDTMTPGDVLCGADVQISSTKIIPAGSTLTLCPGTMVTMAADTSISVAGKLVVQGSQMAPVKLVGAAAAAGSWSGIVLESGGSLDATFLEIHGASLGVDARAGSSFQIDHLLVDTTSEALNLATNGTVSHGVLHGLGADQPGAAIYVASASPHIVDTLVDQGAYGGVDLIVVTGPNAGPIFDYVEVSDAHCAFHTNQGSGLTISNSYVHHNLFGIMAVATVGTAISHSNFQDNTVNVGSCAATGTGQLTADYFQGDPQDGSCGQYAVSGTVAAPYATDVGPRP